MIGLSEIEKTVFGETGENLKFSEDTFNQNIWNKYESILLIEQWYNIYVAHGTL